MQSFMRNPNLLRQTERTGQDIALEVLATVRSHMGRHVVHTEVLRILRYRKGFVAHLGLTRLRQAKRKRIRYRHND